MSIIVLISGLNFLIKFHRIHIKYLSTIFSRIGLHGNTIIGSNPNMVIFALTSLMLLFPI
jgi:hypothetical protein